MPHIDPSRLLGLREGKRLSRRELAANAKVSERQLARIEASEGTAQVRNHTLQRLARALDVTPQVLNGEAPLPDEIGEPSGSVVQPHALRALRKHNGMSRARLADVSGVPELSIARLESSERTVDRKTAEALATALGTSAETLSRQGSEVPLDPVTSAGTPRTTIPLTPQLALAYDLIGRRYGPTRAQVVELAPLLFALLAEGCLAWRRERVGEVWEALDKLGKLGKSASQLYFAHRIREVELGAGLEEESIDAADLLGDAVRNDPVAWEDFLEEELDAITPFADYLRKLADDLGIRGIVDFFPEESDATVGIDTIWGAEPYQVCADTLTEVTGGSEKARWALVHGDAQLSKMPRLLLLKDAKWAQVDWLEDRLSDEVRDACERFEALLEDVGRDSEQRGSGQQQDGGTGDSP